MYIVYYYDYGSMAMRSGIEGLPYLDNMVKQAYFRLLKDNMIQIKDVFATLDEAYDFILNLADHCEFYSLVDAKGNYLLESDYCNEVRSLSRELKDLVMRTRAQLLPFRSHPPCEN